MQQGAAEGAIEMKQTTFASAGLVFTTKAMRRAQVLAETGAAVLLGRLMGQGGNTSTLMLSKTSRTC